MDDQQPKTSMISVRLVILIVAAGGLGVFFALRTASPPPEPPIVERSEADDLKEISQYDLPGEEPEELAEIDVKVEVDTSEVQNRLVIYLTESHGYYVESPVVRFWWKGDDPDLAREDSIYSLEYRINNYIKANETFKDCFDLTAPELRKVGGDAGTGENWGVRLESYNRAREVNPEEFPPLSDAGRYCG